MLDVKNPTNYNFLGGSYHHNLPERPKGGILPIYWKRCSHSKFIDDNDDDDDAHKTSET